MRWGLCREPGVNGLLTQPSGMWPPWGGDCLEMEEGSRPKVGTRRHMWGDETIDLT